MAKANRKPNQQALRTEARDRVRDTPAETAGRRLDPDADQWSNDSSPRPSVERNPGNASPVTGNREKKSNDPQRKGKRQ